MTPLTTIRVHLAGLWKWARGKRASDNWSPFEWRPALIPPDWGRLHKEMGILPARGTTMVRHKLDYWKVEIDGANLKEYRLTGIGRVREGGFRLAYVLENTLAPPL